CRSVVVHEEVTRAACKGVIHEPRGGRGGRGALDQSGQGRQRLRSLRSLDVGALGTDVELRTGDRSLPGREARIHTLIGPVDHPTGTPIVIARSTGVRRLRGTARTTGTDRRRGERQSQERCQTSQGRIHRASFRSSRPSLAERAALPPNSTPQSGEVSPRQEEDERFFENGGPEERRAGEAPKEGHWSMPAQKHPRGERCAEKRSRWYSVLAQCSPRGCWSGQRGRSLNARRGRSRARSADRSGRCSGRPTASSG